MELVDVKLDGFRRFTEPSSMNVASKMIAIVGPNEAGKSSFLKALEHLNNQNVFIKSGPSLELSRGKNFSDDHVVVEATFALATDDIQAISGIEDTKKCRWYIIRKKVTGSITVELNPRPERSPRLRKRMISRLSKIYLKVLNQIEVNEYDYAFDEQIQALSKELESSSEQLSSVAVERMQTLSQNFRTSGIASRIKELPDIAKELDELADEESETPHRRAALILRNRVPQFQMFGGDERELNSEYSLNGLKSGVSTALGNLLHVAEIDLPRLIRLAEEKDAGEIETITSKANLILRKIFQNSWSQSEVSVHLRVDGDSLHVLVDEGDNRYVQIAERSDGMRQYVALLSFVRLKQSEQRSILLIDEAETHLHYDAQADLVQMLARQDLVAKVIYTTHSIGCLPEDLGTGVRIIEQDSTSSSIIQNWFWVSKEAGFNPLLFGMGAQTLAFIPVRYAVVAEGASDMILLPSLFREASGKTSLGFQIVPGLSEADNDALIQLEKSSPRTAYLTDSDDGGKKITARLKSKGISESHIFSLPMVRKSGVVTEDFVNPKLYVEAVNKELSRSNGAGFEFNMTRLPENNRPAAVEKWCKTNGIKTPNKRAVAYHIVEDRTAISKVDTRRRKSLALLYQKIQTTLGLVEKAS